MDQGWLGEAIPISSFLSLFSVPRPLSPQSTHSSHPYSPQSILCSSIRISFSGINVVVGIVIVGVVIVGVELVDTCGGADAGGEISDGDGDGVIVADLGGIVG